MTFSPEVQEILDRVRSGAPAPKPPRPKGAYTPHRPSRRGENLRGGERPPKYDYAELVRLWRETGSAVEAARRAGCSPDTITRALRALRPEGYTGRSGPRPLDECKRGHDMAVHGRPVKGGGRLCSECKRIRERV